MSDARLRDATIEDAPLLAQIGTRSRRETYAGLLSEALLAGPDDNPFHDRRYWQDVPAKPRRHQRFWIVECATPVGLCQFDGDDGDNAGGAVDRQCLLRTVQRQGLGRFLMAAAARCLALRDLQPLSVWTLEGNRLARLFYERLGGRKLPRRPIFQDQGAPVFEVGFQWDKAQSLGDVSVSRW